MTNCFHAVPDAVQNVRGTLVMHRSTTSGGRWLWTDRSGTKTKRSVDEHTTFRLGVTAFPVKTGWPKSTGVSIVKACFHFPVKSGKQETTAEKHGKSCKIRYVLDASNKSGREAVKRTFHYCLQETSFPASFVYCIKASGLP